MTRRADLPMNRADFHAARGCLLITREPPAPGALARGQPTPVYANPDEGVEILMAVWDDGSVTALSGHVDLGTGLRTALAQIVAEELDVSLDRIAMVLGDTTRAPNQGATIASTSIQIHAIPLRAAAAQARHWLVAKAATLLRVDAALLTVHEGMVCVQGAGEALAIPYTSLLAQQHVELPLDLHATLKPEADYRVVGTRAARVDIPGKATGQLSFVHDMRVPGMLHGRVVRPPYAGADHGDFIGNTLESVDESSIAHIPGIRAVVVIRDFVGIVADREEHAEQALRELRVHWKTWPGITNISPLEQALRNNPSTPRKLVDEGDVDGALANAALAMPRTYIWPYQMHASLGPSCALADWQTQRLTVWAGTQNPHVLRADLSRLTGLADICIDVIRMEAAGR